jgi:hypothetical protein
MFTSVYRVDYFADEAAFRSFSRTEERFVDDSHGALERAAELGKVLHYVKVIRLGFADDDTHIAAFGTSVTHEARPTGHDRRGRYSCGCGAFLRNDADLSWHHHLAGWPR